MVMLILLYTGMNDDSKKEKTNLHYDFHKVIEP